MNRTTFEKGELVISLASTNRERNEELVVVGVGPKYITCADRNYKETNSTYRVKFENDGEWFFQTDYHAYRLYHNIEEAEREKREDEMIKKFKYDIGCGQFTIEEIELFYEIHKTPKEKMYETIDKIYDAIRE